MADAKDFDLIVIGAGPGGYVAAIRAAQLGMKVACVEKQYLGGTCLNVGCIPSKALLDSSHRFVDTKDHLAKHGITVSDVKLDLPAMLKRKDEVVKSLTGGVGHLFKKNKIEHLNGLGTITSPTSVDVNGSTYKTKKILIATGSAPIELPSLKFDGKTIVSSTEALALPSVPKKMILVGAGYIGLELGSVWNRLGSEVIVFEFLDRAIPNMDKELAGQLQRMLEKQGIQFRFKTTIDSATITIGKVKANWSSEGKKGTEEADIVLVCVGRKPMTEGLGLDQVGVSRDKKGFILVDKHFQTSVPGIYAIGDVIGGLMLAHKAEEEGVAAVEIMAGKAGHVNYSACPGVVYTHPEMASVGLTEEQAREGGREITIGKFPFLANGRAKAMGETDGQIKIIGDAKTDRILGVHILHARAGDLISEAVVAMEFAGSCEDLARSFHAHPTLPEAMKEAALAVEKRAIHI